MIPSRVISFAFAPVALLGAIATLASAQSGTTAANTAPDHLFCASVYWLNAAGRPQDRAVSLRFAEEALRAYLSENPGADAAATQQRIIAEGQQRGANLDAGTDTVETFDNDIRACERKYGRSVTAPQAAAPQSADTRTNDQLFADATRLKETDKQAARGLFRLACERSDTRSCSAYADTFTAESFYGSKDSQREEIWGRSQACELGEGADCIKLGKLLDPTNVLSAARELQDLAGAEVAYRRACADHSLAAGCFEYARLMGHTSNPRYDPRVARGFLEEACSMGESRACDRLGQ